MNQILCTSLEKKTDTRIFKIQLILSSIISITLSFVVIFYVVALKQKEELSNSVINNYNISKLYASSAENSYENELNNNLFGIIEIPKINVYYPVFSTINDELLKISPCKFYGDSLESNGNICIAGHNYNNYMFFSNISKLEANDEIFIYDNFGRKYAYIVFDVYEVLSSDLNPILDYGENSKELTLITCNNLNSNRTIVKSRRK